MNIHSLRKQSLRVVNDRSDETVALELLRRDPMFLSIPSSEVSNLVRMAIGIGRGEASEVILAHGTSDPMQIARLLNVRVVIDVEQPVSHGFTILSRYQPKPPTITVYENTLRLCRERLADRPMAGGAIVKKLTDICVAHELYHHRERTEMRFINMTFRVPVINLGFLKVEKSIAALGEIAAHAFAEELLHLPVMPCYLEPSLFESDRPSRPPRES